MGTEFNSAPIFYFSPPCATTKPRPQSRGFQFSGSPGKKNLFNRDMQDIQDTPSKGSRPGDLSCSSCVSLLIGLCLTRPGQPLPPHTAAQFRPVRGVSQRDRGSAPARRDRGPGPDGEHGEKSKHWLGAPPALCGESLVYAPLTTTSLTYCRAIPANSEIFPAG